MEEIKFRAFILGKMYDVVSLDWTEHGLTVSSKKGWMTLPDDNCILMQFSGLHDKNGKEIYEGDIMTYSKHKGYYIIKWKCNSEEEFADCGFDCERDKPSYNYMLPSVWRRMEVVGNIYENPKLLEMRSENVQQNRAGVRKENS